jgi:hypothetical protein
MVVFISTGKGCRLSAFFQNKSFISKNVNMKIRMIQKATTAIFMLVAIVFSQPAFAQQLLLMDYNNSNKPVNDAVIEVDTTDLTALELSAHLKIQNNTDVTLAIFMKKIINHMVDSTSNYFCLNPKCWPDADSTDIADSIPAHMGDSSFVTHYDHFFRYERPIPPGFTSITYLFYDYSTLPEPVEARVTVNYHISGVGMAEKEKEQIILFPVPASDFVRIRVGNNHEKIKRILVYDMQGREMKVSLAQPQSLECLLDVNSLENGIYQAVCLTEKGRKITEKLIIRH